MRAGVTRSSTSCAALCTGGKDAIARIQEWERARTGITSLKVASPRVRLLHQITNATATSFPPTTSAAKR